MKLSIRVTLKNHSGVSALSGDAFLAKPRKPLAKEKKQHEVNKRVRVSASEARFSNK